MKSTIYLSRKVISVGIGVAIAGPLGIATVFNPRQLSQRVTPVIPKVRLLRKNSPNTVSSTAFRTLTTSLLISKGATPHLTHFIPNSLTLSSSASRRSKASTRHPLVWIPSVFLLGFAMGLIRRVTMSLANGRNDQSGSNTSSGGVDANSGKDSSRYSKYSDAGGLGGGSGEEKEGER